MADGFDDAKDSDGVSHRIYKQEEAMSCALACLFMMENQYEQATHQGGEARMKELSGNYPDSLLASQIAGDNNGQGNGTGVINTSKVLPVVGVPCSAPAKFVTWSQINHPTGTTDLAIATYNYALDYKLVRDQRPALLLVAWLVKTGSKWLRAGGHFIVAARVTRRGALVVLDPWDATMHQLQGRQGVYRRNGQYGLITHAIYTH